MKISIKYALYIGFSTGFINGISILDTALAFWYGSVLMEDGTIND